ncbi:MAG: tetratricopeptide repeat protein [Acidobacteria bacterium]|nr:tetratricopeptide repeat protein [Acidobacteriota bacterium]
MKRLAALLITLVAVAAFAQSTTPAPEGNLSPAERGIAQANRLIEKNSKNFEAYNALALALSRRARETSDVKFYTQAEDTLQKSFAISPGNFDGERIRVWLLLGKHEFGAAREEALKLIKKMPDDVMVRGFETDANVELGNYKEAEEAAQLMLDLKPGNLPGVTRAAYLRELLGDVDGSLELMNMAYQSTAPSEVEDAAWIITQMAHLDLSIGKTAEAEALLQRALTLFPGYHYALGNLAKVRIQQKRYDEAVNLLEQRYTAAAHAENLYDLAAALQLAGRTDESKKAFADFEQKSLLESTKADNSNHELILYYADYAQEPAKALAVAQREMARRHDVFTIDCYAWALHRNGRDVEAQQQIASALDVGIRDARFFRHAGEIALALGDKAKAEHYLRQSVDLNAGGSEQARVILSTLTHSGMQQVTR